MIRFWLLFILFVFAQPVLALDIVYPKKLSVTINSPSTFFVGSANTDKILTINDEVVQVHKSGGFAHSVTLKEGRNDFILKSGEDIKIYKINRPNDTVKTLYSLPKFVKYKSQKTFFTVNERVPLRETPINSGINRTSHLTKGTELIIDGEKGEFYRVVLGAKNYGWVLKSDVKLSHTKISSLAKVFGYDYIDAPDYFTFIFHLDRKVAFSIEEGKTFKLHFYNITDCPDNTYEFEFPYSEASGSDKIMGYNGYFDGNDFIFKVRRFCVKDKKHPLKGVTIAIDAGHGGKEFGAIGCCGDKEKDINLSIAKYLERELRLRGANVVMTRDKDVYMGLNERVDFANSHDAVILLSIHANALPDSANPLEHRGTSVYYYYNQAKLLSANILVSMNKQVGTQNDNIRQGSLALVRNTSALSVLVETAYLINPEDNAMLMSTSFRKKCAKAIADGIENFFKD